MKKYQVAFLFVFLVGCSSSPDALPMPTSDIVMSPSLIPTETAILPTQTLTLMPTFTPIITPSAIGGSAGKIAFTSERDGYPEIYVVNADGSGLIKLANDITPKFNPAWSPDGKKIAFGSNTNDAAGIYIMNADGSNPIQLIDTTRISVYDQATPAWRFVAFCCTPVWSPNGEKIAFQINHYVGSSSLRMNIYVIDTDGSNLISISDQQTGVSVPVWSPDGQKIAFWGNCPGLGICVMNADGTHLINLTRNERGGAPVWSPDGKKIAFATDWGGDAEIYVMNADGTDPISLTPTGSSPWESNPIWSPDSKKIAFVSYRDGNYEIYAVNADGTDLVNLTNNPVDEGGQAWSPDSTKIAFASGRDGNLEIYVVDINGDNLHRLTDNGANDYSPVWSP